MMTIEGLREYVLTLVEIGDLGPLSFSALQAVDLLFEHGLIASSTEEDNNLTPQSLLYIYTVCRHDLPLAAEHLLSTLECFGLLNELYLLNEVNFVTVAETAYPEEIASILDKVYSRHIAPETAQEYFEKLQRLTIGESQVVEKNLALLQVRILQRMSSATLSAREFEDELQIALNSMNASRENLAALAFDPESAIQPLTESEERRLKKAIEYYAPRIEEKGGVEVCYASLLKALETRYNQNPMHLSIVVSSNETPFKLLPRFSLYTDHISQLYFRLPLEWEDFNKLPLTEANRKRALLLYCSNPVHTAYRFFKDLDAPGPWLAAHKYWESFTKYKAILAMLWFAVNDENMPPISDYTFEGRIDYFINSFAEFRRDKNNEGRRECTNEPGKYEYYDDQELDKPSCGLGFRDRVYDAVKGHPLFETLTAPLMLKEVQLYVLEHFKQTIKNKPDMDVLDQLHQAWVEVLIAESTDHVSQERMLARLDVPKKAQNEFLSILKSKYVDLAESEDLIRKYWEFFSLTPIFPTHAHRFGSTFLKQLLEDEMTSRKEALEQEVKVRRSPARSF